MAIDIAVFIGLLAAGCFLIGARGLGRQLLGVAVAGAVLVPVGLGVLASVSVPSTAIAVGGGVLAVLAVSVGFVRFHDRRRRLAKFMAKKPTSLKRRVDRI